MQAKQAAHNFFRFGGGDMPQRVGTKNEVVRTDLSRETFEQPIDATQIAADVGHNERIRRR